MARRQAVRREERVGATPQTLAKLKPDPIMVMRLQWDRAGDDPRAWGGPVRPGLSAEHEDAVMSIRDACQIITGHLDTRLASWMRKDKSYEGDNWPDPVKRLVEKFNDWADAMHRKHLSVMCALDNIIDEGPGWVPNEAVLKSACEVWCNLSS